MPFTLLDIFMAAVALSCGLCLPFYIFKRIGEIAVARTRAKFAIRMHGLMSTDEE